MDKNKSVADFMNSFLNTPEPKIDNEYYEIEEQYSSWAELSWERWNTNPQDQTFSEQVEELRLFFENRFDSIIPCLAEHFGLTGELVTLSLSAENGGAVSLNTLDLDLMDGSWQGRYYTDYPVTLTAQETDGAAFDHWEIEGGSIIEGSQDSASIQVQLEEDTTVRAIYTES